MPQKYTEERLREFVHDILPLSPTFEDALNSASKRWGVSVSDNHLRKLVKLNYGKSPSFFMPTDRRGITPQLMAEDDNTRDVRRIVELVKRKQRTLVEICDVLNLWPARVRFLVDQAVEEGYALHIHDGDLHLAGPQPAIAPVSIPFPKPKYDFIVAFFGDTHGGSRCCAEHELADFIEKAYERGARDFIHLGDWVDGINMYRGQRFELKHTAVDDQIDLLLDILPQKKNLRYVGITGNHDDSIKKATGYAPTRMIVDRAAARDRRDIVMIGEEHGVLHYGGSRPGEGIKIELIHPDGGPAYAQSYRIQRYLAEGIPPGDKPQIVLMGHFHQYVKVHIRNVYGFYTGCWQWQTRYLKRKHKHPIVGGIVCRIKCDQDYRILSLSDELITYDVSRAYYDLGSSYVPHDPRSQT